MELNNIQQEAREFLTEHVTAAVATVSRDGTPYVSTMYFCIDENFNFYFLTSAHSQKLKDIEVNKNIAVVVGFGPQTITIQAGGVAEIVVDQDEMFMNNIFKKIKFKNLDQWPVLHLEKEGIVILKLNTEWMTLLNFDKEGHPKTFSHEIQKVI
jgi:general stress protein 26